MKYVLNGILIIFLIFVTPHFAYSQSTSCDDGKILNSTGQCVLKCGQGTILDNSTGQCILQCGEGTHPVQGTCMKEPQFGFGQLEAIGIGILVGLGATLFGIAWTIKLRGDEKKREDLELIQNYGNKLSEINSEEKNLETKLDCALYAERYLDTLDQIASLLEKDKLRREVADYFENHFRYGINLWYWYKENLEKIPRDLLEKEFWKEPMPSFKDWYKGNLETISRDLLEKVSGKEPMSSFKDWKKENIETISQDLLEKVSGKESMPSFKDLKKETRDYFLKLYKEERDKSEADRWFYFRWWCNFEEYLWEK